MTRIVITGGAGRLGSKLGELLTADGKNTVLSLDLPDFDVTDFATVRLKVNDFRPDLVIHSAAWTDVDGCAQEPDKAMVINGLGAGNVATAAANMNTPIVYVSTNEVFAGERPDGFYREYDERGPVNPYGYSKYVGEREIADLNPRHYIVRTSWLFAHGGRNFLQAIINAAGAGKDLRVVTDEVANPTYTDDLAVAITQLVQTGRFGTYHLVNEGKASRWAFARYVLDQTGYAETPIAKISVKEWPRPSTPPAYCGMANIAAAQLGVRLRPWQEAVTAFLAREGLLLL